MRQRHSKTNVNPQPLFVPRGQTYRDGSEKRDLESRNGVIQARYVIHRVSEWTPQDRVTPDLLKELQRLAVNQLYRCAGFFRNDQVWLDGSIHQPPPHDQVVQLVDEMCAYVTDNWETATAAHLSAYLMWRMNWIHPFFGGNGRTARAISYLVLCTKLGFVLPGTKTIPEMICEDRDPYYASLRKADAALTAGQLDVSAMEDLVSDLLAEQLVQIHEQATGKKMPSGK